MLNIILIAVQVKQIFSIRFIGHRCLVAIKAPESSFRFRDYYNPAFLQIETPCNASRDTIKSRDILQIT